MEIKKIGIFPINFGFPGDEEQNPNGGGDFMNNLMDLFGRKDENPLIFNECTSLPDSIKVPFEEFEALWETGLFVLVNSTKANFVPSLKITEVIDFKKQNKAAVAIYMGSTPKIVKRIVDLEIIGMIHKAIKLESLRKNLFAEEKVLETAKSVSEDELTSLQKLLDRKLVLHCTDLMTFNGAPYRNLIIEKDGSFDDGYVVSFKENGAKKDKMRLDSETGEELFGLQTKAREMDLVVKNQEKLLKAVSFKLKSLKEKFSPILFYINEHFVLNPVSEGKVFAVAIDPKDKKPCIFVMAKVQEETSDIPKVILRKFILDHLAGRKLLSLDHQIALRIPEMIEEIEEIFSRLRLPLA